MSRGFSKAIKPARSDTTHEACQPRESDRATLNPWREVIPSKKARMSVTEEELKIKRRLNDHIEARELADIKKEIWDE